MRSLLTLLTLFGGLAVAAGDADRGGDRDRAAGAEVEGLAQGVDDAPGDPLREPLVV